MNVGRLDSVASFPLPKHEATTMPKGRRERDRPKAGPDALYNPNKRVKLSYDSESEAESGAEESIRVQRIAQKKEQDEHAASTASNTRSENSRPVQEGADLDNLRAAGNPGKTAEQQDEDEQEAADSAQLRRKDHRTGQLHALGSLSWQGEGEEGGTDEGGLDPASEYLRAVRSQRLTLPSVLAAPQSQPNKKVWSDDFAGFANDHAVVAAPDTPVEQQDRSTDPREAFTNALKERFLEQRRRLHLQPSSEAVAALDDKHPISFPPHNHKAKTEWLKLLGSVAPAAAQVQSLDEESAVRLLELIQEHYLQRQKEINRTTSAWIWALLARLTEVGLMDNDQVYSVRAFGKKAVLVQVSFRSAEAAAQLEDLANGGSRTSRSQKLVKDSAESTSEGPERVGAELQANTSTPEQESSNRENTLATLDSILVVVGDIFGQRDLLEFRQPWEADEGLPSGG